MRGDRAARWVASTPTCTRPTSRRRRTPRTRTLTGVWHRWTACAASPRCRSSSSTAGCTRCPRPTRRTARRPATTSSTSCDSRLSCSSCCRGSCSPARGSRPRSTSAQPPRLGRYVRARAARILPAYHVVLVVSIVLLWGLQGTPGLRLPPAGELPLFVVFGQNFSPGSVMKLNPPTWSLATEVSFYALLPAVGWLALRVAPRPALAGPDPALAARARHGVQLVDRRPGPEHDVLEDARGDAAVLRARDARRAPRAPPDDRHAHEAQARRDRRRCSSRSTRSRRPPRPRRASIRRCCSRRSATCRRRSASR